MKKVATKKVTIDDLAGMVARGFESVHNEIGEVKKRLGNVEKEIGEVKVKLTKVEENLNTTRMDVLGIGDKFVSKHDFNQHLVRFDLLEQKVKARK